MVGRTEVIGLFVIAGLVRAIPVAETHHCACEEFLDTIASRARTPEPEILPQTVLTVFLSSTAQDLKVHREAVYERLRPIPFLKCIRMEDFGALNADGVEACRDGVKNADLFIGLVGMRRGWEPDGDSGQRSITEMEYDWASEKKCAQFLHVSPDSFPVPGNLYETKDLHDRQIAFRKRVMSKKVITHAGFDTPQLRLQQS